MGWFKTEWRTVLRHAQLHLNLFEPLIAFRRVLFQILDCKEFTIKHLLESASTFRKVIIIFLYLNLFKFQACICLYPFFSQGSRFSLAASALNELKQLCCQIEQKPTSKVYFLGRVQFRMHIQLVPCLRSLYLAAIVICNPNDNNKPISASG